MDTSAGEIKSPKRHFSSVAPAELFDDMLGKRAEFNNLLIFHIT